MSKVLKRIDKVISRIENHPEYSDCLRRRQMGNIQREAARHSVELEMRADPKSYERFKQVSLDPWKNHHVVMRGLREGTGRLIEAWEYIGEYGLDVSSLAVLGNIIEPKANPARYFRQTEVLFGPFLGVSKYEVPEQVDNLLWRLENLEGHPVEKAAEAHTEFVRIHPYEDGSGRAARLVQDFFLVEKGYPPAIIPATDRDLYLLLMKDCLNEKRERSMNDGQDARRRFQEFISSKVLSSAESLESFLQSKRVYEVEIRKPDDATKVRDLSRRIRNYGKVGRKGGVTVSIDRSNGNRKGSGLRVVGDISREQLQGVIERASNGRAKYELRTLVCPGQ